VEGARRLGKGDVSNREVEAAGSTRGSVFIQSEKGLETHADNHF